MRARVLVSIAAGLTAALLLFAGVPGDDRPPPAVIHFTVEPSPEVTGGVMTEDGWQITFERLLLTVGGAGVEDGVLCTRYANAGYERLFDFTVPGQQPLGDVYALGICSLRARMREPDEETLLGKGITAKDLAFMGVDRPGAPITGFPRTLYVRGHAARGDVTKRFAWSLGFDLRVHDCAGADDSTVLSRLDLQSGASRSLALMLHGEELFRVPLADSSPLRFDALAAADIDGDQEVTLGELLNAPGPAPEPDAGPSGSDGGASYPAYFLDEALLRLLRVVGGGACLADLQNPRPRR
jgi:hypothetical protein